MAGATTIEINGVPVTTTAPFPVTLVAGGGGQSNVNVSQFGAVAVGPAVALAGASDETQKGMLVRAQVTGQDLAAAANAKTVAISADTLQNSGSRTWGQVEGLYSIAMMCAIEPSSTTITPLQQKAALLAQSYGAARLLVDGVVRGDDGATYSAVGVRTAAVINGGVATGIQSLMTIAQGYSFIETGTISLLDGCSRELTTTSSGHKLMIEGRARGYYSSLRGRRYVCKSPNLTGVAAATSFVATTPTFLIVCGATKSIVVKRIKANLPLVGTSTTFRMLVKTDTANRFSAGGTARAPQTMNGGNIVATGLAQNLEAPTATAEGGGTKDIDCDSNQLVAGSECVFEAEDGLIIPANGSLLVYVVTATAGATIDYTIEFEEAQVQ